MASLYIGTFETSEHQDFLNINPSTLNVRHPLCTSYNYQIESDKSHEQEDA